MKRPALLFWCQHSLGLGHLVRSLALAEALRDRFDVILLNGGRFPGGMHTPDGVTVVNLVPLGHDDSYELVTHDPDHDVESAKRHRIATILATIERHRPAVVLLELYPFGRKKFAFELDPMLAAIDAFGAHRPKVVCSVRDILVNQRHDQARHDERAARVANAHLDAILVHSDPAFASLYESFAPATPLEVPVYHTGFVTSRPTPVPAGEHRQARVIVSSGGGMVGEPIVRAAVAAHRRVCVTTGLTTTIVAGPFLPDHIWEWLVEEAAHSPWLDVTRQVADLAGEIRRSAVSVSQCGYNTTMDLLRAGTPSVVIPYSDGKEDEQRRRADRLAALGVLTSIDAAELGPDRLAAAIAAARDATPAPAPFSLDGADISARIIAELAGLATPDLTTPDLTTPAPSRPAALFRGVA
ncbi:MAG: glycosyltransferase family protein [Acidimicrobiales bacterium]